MIERLEETTISGVSKRLVQMRSEGGATTLGRVLTLVAFSSIAGVEETVNAAKFASREHPMRIIVFAVDTDDAPDWVDSDRDSPAKRSEPGLNAEIRVGRDAGSGDIIILYPRGEVKDHPELLVSGLLLSDAPVVVWWADIWPRDTANSPLSKIANRRITDSGSFRNPRSKLLSLIEGYRPGDTDLAWSRLTLWRAQLAAALDNDPTREFTGITVRGTEDSSSTLLLAAWLSLQLGAKVTHETTPTGAPGSWGIHSVLLQSKDGGVLIERSHGPFACVSQPDHPDLEVPLPRRPRPQCLAEDLRLLWPDPLFGRVLTAGIPKLIDQQTPATPQRD